MTPSALPALLARDGAVLLKVRAAPGAARERIAGLLGDALKVAVTAPPEKGKANEALARLLASELGLRAAQVKLASGETARDKWFRIEGLPEAALRARLREILAGPELPGGGAAPRRR